MTEQYIPQTVLEIIFSNDSKRAKLAKILRFIVDVYKITPCKYYILGSYGLIIRCEEMGNDERKPSDIDVSMYKDEFDKLKTEFGIVEPYNGQTRWFWDLTKEYQKVDPEAEDFSIEIFRKDIDEGYPTNEYSVKYLMYNSDLSVDEYGHHFMNLETLLKWKREMVIIRNKEKDIADVELIQRLMK
jgi:hypothetical protein